MLTAQAIVHLLDEKLRIKHGNKIFLRKGAEVNLAYKEGMVPKKWVVDRSEPWVVDSNPDEGMINISRLSEPYPGAFCSWVHVDDVEKVVK